MRVEVEAGSPESVKADVLAAAVLASEGFTGPVAALDGRLGGLLARLAEQSEITGKLKTAPLVHVNGDLQASRLALAGIGAREAVDADTLRTAAGTVAHEARSFARRIAWLVDESLPISPAEQARAIVDGTLLGSYDPGRWKSSPEPLQLESLVIVSGDAEVAEATRRAGIVAGWANRARDLANAPPNELTPDGLADRAAEVAAGGSPQLSVEAPNLEEIRELGMGAFAAVAQASHNPARLIVARYEPSQPKGEVVLGLVGKAVTFDTGGISLKKPAYMEDMKGDMAGGGAVIAALGALAELECPLRVIGVVGATENAVGGGAYRPGDILTAMNGKTIEIINTDAEGRLVLADVLAYARQLGTTHLVDFATLTGAMERALGDFYAGVFANDTDWRTLVVESGEASGDHAWPWPLHSRYRRYVDSDYADMKNSNIRSQGVPVLAAEFLHEFAGEGPWAHVDMAGTGFFTWPRHDYLWQRGGTGYGVRLICELADRLAAAD
ncbi:MAG: leucyl aminopeptidase [Actinobacteria bacterium]|nr:MAG: leucyl aminopeptidase [Actinomycetota bacterium]